MSNGVLRDKRVFHIDSPDWNEKYNRQGMFSLVFASFESYVAAVVQLECGITGAWHYGGAKLVQEEAPRRLKTSGWAAVRLALSTTVRYAHTLILIIVN
jgi:hypothetical protein